MMEIRKLTPADTQASKKLWKTAFSDSDALIEEYYRSENNIKNAWGLFDGKALASQLFMPSFCARVMGVEYTVDFLSGCATQPEYRNRHLMRDLIRRAFLDMQQRKVAISFLHPFNHDFYRKVGGYETVAYVKRYTYEKKAADTDGQVAVIDAFDRVPLDAMLRAYNTFAGRFSNGFLRSKGRMEEWLKMLFADGGRVALIRSGDAAAYALYYVEEDGTADLFELVFGSEKELFLLLDAIGKAKFFLPENIKIDLRAGAPEDFTMMRIIDPVRVLSGYPFDEGTEFVIRIHDAFLEREHNLCVRSLGGSTEVFPCDAKSDIEVDISRLAQLVAGVAEPLPQCGGWSPFHLGTSCFFETY
ncbi:MAG: GNAT family N-acetyltransferase [Christensenellaceae bacterium]|jgi:predicted acetyltransferase